MDPAFLAETCKKLGLKNVVSYYHGRFSTWLENKEQRSGSVKALVKGIWLAGKIATKIIPMESRLLSPYIVLKATM